MLERRPIDDELDALRQRLTAMGSLAEERVRQAVNALSGGDRAVLLALVESDKPVNDLQMEIDDRCFRLLALHQPVAGDLRLVVASTRLTAELERIGDLAVNIAETGSHYLTHRPIKPLIDIPRMSTIAQQMLSTAIQAVLTPSASLAELVLPWDDQLDELNAQVFRVLLTYMLADARTIEPATELILIASHLKRIGDHATNIAEEAIFIVEARDSRRGRATVDRR